MSFVKEGENIYRRKLILTAIDTLPGDNSRLKKKVNYVPLPFSDRKKQLTRITAETPTEIPTHLLKQEAKWFLHTVESCNRWVNMVEDADTYTDFLRGISDITGLPVSTIREGVATENYREFAEHPREYVDEFIEGIKKAFIQHKWAKKMMEQEQGQS